MNWRLCIGHPPAVAAILVPMLASHYSLAADFDGSARAALRTGAPLGLRANFWIALDSVVGGWPWIQPPLSRPALRQPLEGLSEGFESVLLFQIFSTREAALAYVTRCLSTVAMTMRDG